MMYDLIIIDVYYVLTLLGVPFVVLSTKAYGIKPQTALVYLIVLAHIANEVAFLLSLPSHDGGISLHHADMYHDFYDYAAKLTLPIYRTIQKQGYYLLHESHDYYGACASRCSLLDVKPVTQRSVK